ncbi:MAG: ABC transporter permease subunit, partial [Acidimicrobiia bacterium]
MKTLLAPNTRARSAALGLGTLILVLLFTQFVLPGGAGGGRGTPVAMLFLGLTMGLVNSLTAVGLVLVYRTVRVINFAQTALGAVGGLLFFDVVRFTKIPFVIAFAAALVVAVAVGALFDIVLRRFQNASRLIVMVFTVAVATLIGATVAQIVRSIPLVPEDASLEASLGGGQLRPFLPFPGFEFRIGDLNFPFGFPEVFALEVVTITLIIVGAIFKFTKVGVAMRAMAGNVERAALLGISVGAVTMTTFIIAAVLGTISTMMTGAITTPGSAFGIAPGVLLPALAAAVIARFDRIPTAVIAAVLIRVVSQAFVYSYDEHARLVDVAIFLIIGVGLFFQRKRLGRSEAAGGVSWQTVDEPRPIPKELSGVATVRIARWAIIVIGALAVIIYPFLAGTGNTVLGSGIVLSAIVTLSIVVLTGWSGQVSLGQFGFYAIGAVLGGALSSRLGIPGGFWVAVPLA